MARKWWWVLMFPGLAVAQTTVTCDPTLALTYTTNMSLAKPPYRYCRPDVPLNANADLIDGLVGKLDFDTSYAPDRYLLGSLTDTGMSIGMPDQTTTSSGNADDGGQVDIYGGNGEDATGSATSPGVGGGVGLWSGSGGTTSVAAQTAGDGGAITIQAGPGGGATSGTSGNGGSVQITAGIAGDSASGTDGAHGNVGLYGQKINLTGAVNFETKTVALTIDDTPVLWNDSVPGSVIATYTMILMTSTSATASQRTFTLQAPVVAGQLLVLLWNDTDAGELADAAGTQLINDRAWYPKQNSILMLLAITSSAWAEVARIDNATIGNIMPTTQTIAAGNTITADACGGVKRIDAAGAVTTDTTNTITAPDSYNNGCRMIVCNVGSNAANDITLDVNANIKLAGGANLVLDEQSCIGVFSDGTVWRQTMAEFGPVS